MKTRIICLSLFTMIALTFSAYAEPWHTASGKSYDVFASARPLKQGEEARFYYLTYQTTAALNDKTVLEAEFHDLLTHFYHFRLPEKMKNDKNSVVAVETFTEFPKSGKDKKPSVRYAKKLPELAAIAKNNKQTDPNRFEAIRNIRQKNYKAAISFSEKIKDKVPHDFLRAANTYLFLKNKNGAIGQFEAGIKKYPQDTLLLNNLAAATMVDENALTKGQFTHDPKMKEKALEILARAQKANPREWQTQYNMALVENAAQNPDAAEKHYKEALKLSGESINLHYRLANFYHMQKKFSNAKKHYGKAIKKLKTRRSPAAERRIKFLEDRLKLVKEKKLP